MPTLPSLPFAWVANHPALDFANTVSWGRAELSQERLTEYPQLARWAVEAGLLPGPLAPRLLARARGRPGEARAVLGRALQLREAIHDLGLAQVRRAAARPEAMTRLNRFLAQALPHLRIDAGRGGFRFDWAAETGEDLDRVLWPVVWAAAGLVTAPDTLQRLGACANPECGWLFVDTSRSGQRRWCDMRECGNRAKARQHRRRQRT